ncbi:hypothetical protein [Streptomyces similanensis]|uniref:Uncharacterized protein n=1 Tax=Streptomyces similanensis TaxID=1274988 RepID=A0ABP9L7L7_9ACTN
MAAVVRTYLITNASALFGEGARIRIYSAAPAGFVVRRVIGGRPVAVLLTDSPLPGHGNVLIAELQDCYL